MLLNNQFKKKKKKGIQCVDRLKKRGGGGTNLKIIFKKKSAKYQ